MHQPFPLKFRLRLLAASLVAVACISAPPSSRAQAANATNTASVQAQRQYELEIAVCNNANYPAPRREVCVREAGIRLDGKRGMPGEPAAAESADGRATVMAPNGGSTSLRGSSTATSNDGRATVVVPETTTTQ